jgi:hypothetical protein
VGWQLDVVANSKPAGTTDALPIIALRSPLDGAAVWIIAGIHGEEPAGPNAIAKTIDEIAALAEHQPMVVIPLCNRYGFARNWRYLNTPVYSKATDGQSVGDSSHLLPDPGAEQRGIDGRVSPAMVVVRRTSISGIAGRRAVANHTAGRHRHFAHVHRWSDNRCI